MDEFWAVERTHPGAKTIAQAEAFVEEAFGLMVSLEAEPRFRPIFESQGEEIIAGLHIFAGRRLIDAGHPAQALAHFRRAWTHSPRQVLAVWYKVVQAAGGRLGLNGLFLSYRRVRRSVRHAGRQLEVTEDGLRWSNA
jgi:hypothetical protein